MAGRIKSDTRNLEVNVPALLNNRGEFVVSEYKAINVFMAIFFGALFTYGIYDAVGRRLSEIDYQSYIFTLAIIPVIMAIRRIRQNRVYIRINSKGIHLDENLLCSWQQLLNAGLTQEPRKGIYDMSDHFVLMIEYVKLPDPKTFRKKIPLTNTQNKSEEEVLAAVKWFWLEYRKGIVS